MESIQQAQSNHTDLKPKWQERFAFIEQHGRPGSATYKQALRGLSFGKRILINSSILAFFFGPIYWFVLGLWKKNLAVIGIILAIGVIEGLFEMLTGSVIPAAVDNGIGFAVSLTYAILTPYAYYLKRLKNHQSWNPWEGHGKG